MIDPNAFSGPMKIFERDPEPEESPPQPVDSRTETMIKLLEDAISQLEQARQHIDKKVILINNIDRRLADLERYFNK